MLAFALYFAVQCFLGGFFYVFLFMAYELRLEWLTSLTGCSLRDACMFQMWSHGFYDTFSLVCLNAKFLESEHGKQAIYRQSASTTKKTFRCKRYKNERHNHHIPCYTHNFHRLPSRNHLILASVLYFVILLQFINVSKRLQSSRGRNRQTRFDDLSSRAREQSKRLIVGSERARGGTEEN